MLVSVSLWLGQGGDKIENGERMEHQMLTNRRDESIERRITKSEKNRYIREGIPGSYLNSA